MTNWEEIQEEFETSDITMRDLALKHDVKPSTLRSRKNREGWSRDELKKKATQQKKNVATRRNKKKSVATEKVIQELNDNDELTDKQKRFCLFYLRYFNATKAYQEAYECDYNSARNNGSRMLANDSIKKELDRLKKAQHSELYIDSLDIKREWLKQSFADITDFLEFKTHRDTVLEKMGTDPETGEPMLVEKERAYSQVLLKHSDDVDGTLIQEVKQGRDGISLKLYDKQKAMDKLMEFLQDERLLKLEQLKSQLDKTEKEKEYIDERIKLMKGDKKDTSLLDVLLETVTKDE